MAPIGSGGRARAGQCSARSLVPRRGARAGGVPDVIDKGVDGVLVEFGDPDELTGAIQELLEHPERARSMGRKGRAKVEKRYTWDHIHKKLQAIYQRCLA